MKIKDRPEFKNKPAPVVLPATEYASTGMQIMAQKNRGSVIVTADDRTIKGIVTERDLLRRLLGKELDQKTTLPSGMMTVELRIAHVDTRSWTGCG